MIGALLTVAALALTAVVSARLGTLLLPRYAAAASPPDNGSPSAESPYAGSGAGGDARHLHSVDYLEAFDVDELAPLAAFGSSTDDRWAAALELRRRAKLAPVDDGPADNYGAW